jgi:hypothetical protein
LEQSYPDLTQQEINIKYDVYFPLKLREEQNRNTRKREASRKEKPTKKMKQVDGNSIYKAVRRYHGAEKTVLTSPILSFFDVDSDGRKTHYPFPTVYSNLNSADAKDKSFLAAMTAMMSAFGPVCHKKNMAVVSSRKANSNQTCNKHAVRNLDTKLHLFGRNCTTSKNVKKLMQGPFDLPLPIKVVRAYKNYNFNERSPFEDYRSVN